MVDKRISKWALAFLILWTLNFSADVDHHRALWAAFDGIMIVWNIENLIKEDEE